MHQQAPGNKESCNDLFITLLSAIHREMEQSKKWKGF